MKNTKYKILALILVSYQFCAISQSYKFKVFSEPYTSLINYNSYCNEKGATMDYPFYLKQVFDLDFVFPYFDLSLDSLYLDSDAVVDHEGSAEEGYYPMYLFSMESYFAKEVFDPTQPLDSDIRYVNTSIDNKKVFILEFYKVVSGDYVNTEITYQQRFWENGDIDIAFGDIVIPDSIFVPDIGFRYDYGDTIEYYPATIAIVNVDQSLVIEIGGDLNDNPVVHFGKETLNNFGIYRIPQKNTVARFYRESSSTNTDIITSNLAYIVNDYLVLPTELDCFYYSIYDVNGSLIIKSSDTNLDLSSLNSGIYILNVVPRNGNTRAQKLVKF